MLRLEPSYPNGLRPLSALFLVEAYLIAFGQRLKAFTFNSAKVNKHIVSALALDKTIALTIIKPLYSTFRHFSDPS